MIQKLLNQVKFAAVAAPVYAANDIEIKPGGGNTTFTPLTNLTAGGIISGAISLVLIVVALVFFFILILGGLKWITSGGDEKAVGAARAQITNALIGLAIIFAAWAIISLVGTVFGVNLLQLTIPTFQK